MRSAKPLQLRRASFCARLLCIAGIFGCAGLKAAEQQPPFWSERNTAAPLDPAVLGVFSELFRNANPAVVNISALQLLQKSGSVPLLPGTPPTRKNLGSGAIIRADGYILTNYHVVQNEKGVAVTLADGSVHRAKVIGQDRLTDVALVKIEAKEPLPTLPLADSTRLQVGQWVAAIGNPFGFNNTITHGIVSGSGRIISGEASRKRFDNFLQIDVAINPGNSGGPLLNLAGEIVGINTAMTSTGAGVAFAVPINVAKQVLADLYRYGRVQRGWLGVVSRELNAAEVSRLKTGEPRGLVVMELVRGGPAHRAGLRKGDLLISLDAKPLDSLEAFSRDSAESRPGSTILLELKRGGQLLTIPISVGNLDEALPNS